MGGTSCHKIPYQPITGVENNLTYLMRVVFTDFIPEEVTDGSRCDASPVLLNDRLPDTGQRPMKRRETHRERGTYPVREMK